jgi:hypothetical protein
MTKTIANVLVGVATLEVGTPVGNRAEWSDEQHNSGDYSVKLSKLEGNYGSTSVQINTTGNAAAQTLTDFQTMALHWGWWHFRQAVNAYWEQMELRFTDPANPDNWVDVTVQADVMAMGAAAWVQKTLVAGTNVCYFGGWNNHDGSFANWAPALITGVVAAADAAAPLQVVAHGSLGTWTLTRVKLELWETVPPMTGGHYVFVDDIEIDGVVYTLEPGTTASAAIILSAPFTEVGYTEDGVTMTYTAETADIDVVEETYSIDRVITKEITEVTCNMAESSLFNIDKAMAGALLSGNILKLGAGVNKKITLQIRGTNPAGFIRAILIPSCTATGAVGMAYKKGVKTVVPVTFQALKTPNAAAVTIVDNAA